MFSEIGASSRKIAGTSIGAAEYFGSRFSNVDHYGYCNAEFGWYCGTTTISGPYECRNAGIDSCGTPGGACPTFVSSSGVVGKGTNSGVGIQGILNTAPGQVGLNNPTSLAVSPSGEIVVADRGNNVVKAFDLKSGTVRVVAGNGDASMYGDGGAALSAAIQSPQAVGYDAIGNLYILSASGYIKKVDTKGVISHVAGLPFSMGGVIADEAPANLIAFNNPQNMIVDKPSGKIYVANTGGHSIYVIDVLRNMASIVAGNKQCDTIGSGDGESALGVSICNPRWMSLDSEGNLVVVDAQRKRIKKIHLNSSESGEIQFAPLAADGSLLSRKSEGTWVRRFRDGTSAYFSSNGFQTAMVDRLNRRVEFEYDSSMRLTQILYPFSGVMTLSYSGGKLSSITDPAGRTTRFISQGGRLSSIFYPDGASKAYEYDEGGLMLREKTPRGDISAFKYNDWNRIEEVRMANGSVISVNDRGSATSSNEYSGSLKSSGLGDERAHTYFVDGNGNRVEMRENIQGLVAETMNAAGQITRSTRDLKGNVLKTEYPNGDIEEYVYDSLTNDRIETRYPNLGVSEKKTFNSYGQVTSQTNGNGKTIYAEYDGYGLLKRQVFPNGDLVEYQYNNLGLMISKIYSSLSKGSISKSYEYDSRGNVTSIVDESGKITSFEYDLAGNITKRVNTNGSMVFATEFTYDLNNMLLTVKNPKGEIAEYSYWPDSLLKEQKDTLGQITSFEYDPVGNLIKKSEPGGGTYRFEYDANGNRILELDPNGSRKVTKYNDQGQVSETILSDDHIFYTYDQRGGLSTIANKNAKVSVQKDAKRRIASMQTEGINEMRSYPTYSVEYNFDSADNLRHVTTPYGSISYGFDDNSRVVSLVSTWGDNFSFGYDIGKRLSSIRRPGSVTEYEYGDSNLLTKVSNKNGATTISFTDYVYDSRNLPSQVVSDGTIALFEYDSMGRLTKEASPALNSTYAYDEIGNRILDSQGSYNYSVNKQLLESDSLYVYSYDSNGNLILKIPKDSSRKAYKYTYSSLNQLKNVEVMSSILGAVEIKVEFEYDPFGNRISKKIIQEENIRINRYLYNGRNVFAQLGNSNELLAIFTYSPLSPDDILSVKITNDGVSSGISKIEGQFFYLKDGLNTVTDIVNSQGKVIQKYRYSAFGKIISISDSVGADISSNPTIDNPFTFTGKQWDKEIGVYYYGARYYDPSIGRFIQKDPSPGYLERPESIINKFIYAANNPIINIDSSGMDLWGDITGFFHLFAAGVMQTIMGIIHLDLAQVLTGLAMFVEFYLAPINLIKNGRLPKYYEYEGMPVVQNSLLAEVVDKPGFSLGAGAFVRYEPDERELELTMMHEYGHYLQYKAWGGWEYIKVGWEEKGINGPFEFDADRLACEYFGDRFSPRYDNHEHTNCSSY